MNKSDISKWMLTGLLFVLMASQAAGQPFSASMSQPHDTINGISLATGAGDAVPLWTFCSAAQENTHVRTFHCRASASQTLSVGYLFLLADAAIINPTGADLVWQLSIDNRAVDLESFGSFDYMMPAVLGSPSPVRQVFVRMTDWNLVLTDLRPGEHTLYFLAQNGTDTYMWLAHLVIQESDQMTISSAGFKEKILIPRQMAPM